MIDLLAASPVAFVGVVFLFSLLVGSFLNVVIHRLPLMMERDWRAQCEELAKTPAPALPEGRFNLVVPRSRCPACGAAVTALQNVPVLSYLALKGRCASCGTRISLRYPVVELLTAVLAAVIAWRFGLSWEAAAGLLLTFALVAISAIDLDHQLIPDAISLPLVWAGLALSLWHPLPGAEVLFIGPRDAIIGALAGYLSLWSVYHLFRLLTGKEGMGYGDFKLLAALGAWLGWQKLPLIILLSALVGALVGVALIAFRRHDRNVPIPFGPYLAAAGWVALVWGDRIVDWYLDFAG